MNRQQIAQIMDTAEEVLDNHSQRHAKTLAIRFDLGYPDESDPQEDERKFQQFITTYTRNLSRNKLDPSYIWAREKSSESDHDHLHVLLLLDGKKTSHLHNHIKLADKLWSNINSSDNPGLVHHCITNNSGERLENPIMLDRAQEDFEESKEAVLNLASYLAKSASKENINGTRRYGRSIRKEPK